MPNSNSEIFDFSQFNTKNGVIYLSVHNDEFEKLYIETREKENRVLLDEEVKNLPNTNSSYKLHNEWNLRVKTTRRFLSYLDKNKFDTILDLGCGNGWFTNLLAQSNEQARVCGIDVNATELEQAARVFDSKNVSFLYCDIFSDQLPFAEKFDLITLNASVQYFADFGKLLERITQFLKPNGEIHILDSPFYKKEEIEGAKERTRNYFQSAGNERLSNFYFHHTFSNIQGFEILYEPKKGIQKRFLKQAESPFLWLKYKKDNQLNSVNKGFSKIAEEYESFDATSSLVNYMRRKVRQHLEARLGSNESVLEINCGSGIDALYLAKKGHSVLATDVADGMLEQVKMKIISNKLEDKLNFKNLSFLEIGTLNPSHFSCVFSNFGGLNCIDGKDLVEVINDIAQILPSGGLITLVIMPKVTFFEWLTFLRGNKSAFRRLKKGGVIANVEGEKVHTYYHTARFVKNRLKNDFEDIRVQNIFTIGPSGSSYQFPENHPRAFAFAKSFDKFSNKTGFLKGFGDYYIISGRKK
ncbi:MAG: methyltransferase domain-containing protein [Flavobacteriales bacterium]